MITGKALWHTSFQHSEIREQALELKPGEVLIKANFSLVSQGTERTVASGHVPISMHEVMRVPYMEGDFSFPIKYGYSLVGEIIDGVRDWVGKKVHLMHPHQDYVVASIESLFELPNELPLQRATLISNLETGLNAVWDARLSAGDRVVVVGFGGVGALIALLAKQFPGTEVWVVEPSDHRNDLARQSGLKTCSSGEAQALKADISFHCSAQSAGLQAAIEATGQEGKIVELSWYGSRAVEVKLGTDFHYGRKQLISSQVSHLPAERVMRWDYNRRKEIVVELLQQEIWDKLIEEIVPFTQAPKVFDALRAGNWNSLNCCLAY